MHGKVQPVQRPQGKREHSYRFLELPQVFAAVWSTVGEWGVRTARHTSQGRGQWGVCQGVRGGAVSGRYSTVQLLPLASFMNLGDSSLRV